MVIIIHQLRDLHWRLRLNSRAFTSFKGILKVYLVHNHYLQYLKRAIVTSLYYIFGHYYLLCFAFHFQSDTYLQNKGCTFQELGKQTMSSANFQAEHLLSSIVFDISTSCSAWKVVRPQSLFTELLKSAAFRLSLKLYPHPCKWVGVTGWNSKFLAAS